MSDLSELYQDVIIDHSQHPRNFREIAGAQSAEGYNPLCGDRVKVYVAMEDDRVTDASFTGAACAICTASASMMTQAVRDKPRADVGSLFERFHDLLTQPHGEDEPEDETLGELASLGGVRRFPMRVKCATLPWHTLKAALNQQPEPVTTE
jgi:nitrogen fixation protein NifU and related proteins